MTPWSCKQTCLDIYYIEDFFLILASDKFSYGNKRLDLAILVISIFFYKITLAIVLCYYLGSTLQTTDSYTHMWLTVNWAKEYLWQIELTEKV